MSTRAKRILIIVAALLAVAAVVAVFFQAGQQSVAPTPSASPIPTATATKSTATPSSTLRPSDNGSAVPPLPKGHAVALGGGSKTGPAELPLGYDHSETGAVEAATNYYAWFVSQAVLDPAVTEQMITATAADPEARADINKYLHEWRDGIRDATRVENQPARGAYAVESYSPSAAAILIWLPLIYEDKTGKHTTWGVYEVKIRWSAGDWKLPEAAGSGRLGGTAGKLANPEGIPTPEEKAWLLTRPPEDPGQIEDAYLREWKEYANASR